MPTKVNTPLILQQGVFRGLQDARTPLQCSLTSNFLNILLAPVLIFWLGWGVKGAAAAIIIAQVSDLVLMLKLMFIFWLGWGVKGAAAAIIIAQIGLTHLDALLVLVLLK